MKLYVLRHSSCDPLEENIYTNLDTAKIELLKNLVEGKNVDKRYIAEAEQDNDFEFIDIGWWEYENNIFVYEKYKN